MKAGGLRQITAIATLALIVASQVVFLPQCAHASTEAKYISVYSKDESFWSGGLHFKDINFHDFSNTTILAFGISGEVEKSDGGDVDFTSEVRYYTSRDELVAISSTQQKAIGYNTTTFAQMSNIDIIRAGYDVSDISHYTVSIDTVGMIKDEGDLLIPSKNPRYAYEDYVIDAYDIDIEVGDNNVYYVKEKITAYFNDDFKHGIVRTLPLSVTMERLDGTTSAIRTKIRDLQVSEKYSTSHNNGRLDVRIGDADEYVHGKHEYEISYYYNFGKDVNDGYDEFYYNLIGQDWDTAVGGITFSIHMPKKFDVSKIGFSSGRYGSTDNSLISYTTTGNTITGKYDGILARYNGITIRAVFDDGYYVETESMIEKYEYIIFCIPIVCLLISAALWLKFGRDDHSIESIEFYPPDGLNSLDVALLFNGRVKKEDVITLLFVLANKGYIRIEEKEKSHGKEATYTIQLLKKYDGDNENERLFFEGLFNNSTHKKSDSGSKQDESQPIATVTIASLKNKFYKTIDSILKRTNQKSYTQKYFEDTKVVRWIVIGLAVISFIVPMAVFLNVVSSADGDIVSFIVAFIFYTPFWGATIASKNIGKFRVIPFLFITMHFCFVVIGVMSPEIFASNIESFYIIGIIAMAICVSLMILFIKLMPRRTRLGSELYGKIKGLRTFIKTADQYHLEQIVLKDKQYAYRLLPYAYVLGLSKKWMKKFEDLGAEMNDPEWFNGDISSYSALTHGLDSMMKSANKSLYTSPQTHSSGGGFSSSGGGFSSGGSSGGGFSGGGGGGGGGHSW